MICRNPHIHWIHSKRYQSKLCTRCHLGMSNYQRSPRVDIEGEFKATIAVSVAEMECRRSSQPLLISVLPSRQSKIRRLVCCLHGKTAHIFPIKTESIQTLEHLVMKKDSVYQFLHDSRDVELSGVSYENDLFPSKTVKF